MTVLRYKQEIKSISGDEQNLLDVLKNMTEYLENNCAADNCSNCTPTEIIKIAGLLSPYFNKIVEKGNINSSFLENFREIYEEFYRVSSTAGNSNFNI